MHSLMLDQYTHTYHVLMFELQRSLSVCRVMSFICILFPRDTHSLFGLID